MGAKNCPETPRQKMIAMMYLVLTALLALNVSADILNAFVTVNESIEESSKIFFAKVEANYEAFAKAMAENEKKARPFMEKAQQVKKLSDDLVNFIENTKYELISITEGISIEEAKNISLKDIDKKDNYDIPTNYFTAGSHDGSKGKARELRLKIEEYRKAILDLVPEEKREEVSKKIGLELKSKKDLSGIEMPWEMGTFYHIILAADIVILNKLIVDVRNAESTVVTELLASIGETDFKFNKISARVVPRSRFVIAGEEYLADIFVAAYDTLESPVVEIGDAYDSTSNNIIGNVQTLEGDKGIVQYKIQASGVGLKKFGGVIKVRRPGGGFETFGFNEEYIVAAPTATVSPEKMNVFYIGVDNPISVSVPGVPNEHVRISASNARLQSTGSGKYKVRVDGGTEATINVSAEMNGQVRSMGSFKFRVKRVPDPKPTIAGVSEGNVDKAKILASPYIIPNMGDFVFDLNFTVSSFTFTIQLPNGDLIERQGNGNKLTEEMLNYIRQARKGTRMYLERIRAQGPDGTRNIGTISLRLM